MDVEPGDSDWELKPSGPGTARIDEPYTSTLLEPRLVGMSTNDRRESRRCRVKAQGFQVVEDIQPQVINVDNRRFWNGRGPGLLVIIATHGDDGCHRLQALEHFRPANIAGMDDPLSTEEGCHGLGAQQAVCVGDNAYKAATERPCVLHHLWLPVILHQSYRL